MNPAAHDLLDALPEPMAIFSPQGALLSANRAFARLFAATPAELCGREGRTLFLSVQEAFERFFLACCGTSSPVFGKVTIRVDGADMQFPAQGASIRLSDGARGIWLRLMDRSETISQFALLNQQIEVLGREVAARLRSEAEANEARERLTFLAQATAVLGASLDYDTTLAEVARLAVPRFADWSAVHVLGGDGVLRKLESYHHDPRKRELARWFSERYPARPNSKYGAQHVVRTGRTEIMSEIPDSVLVEAAVDEEQLRILRELGLHSYICVPLVARQTVLGALTLIAAESKRRYSDADVELLEDIGRRCGAAIDQARLYTEAARASSLLHTVLRQMPVGVIVAEAPSGRILFNSDSGAIMGTGFHPTGNVAHFDRLKSRFPDTAPEDLPLRRALRGETVPQMDLRFIRTDGVERMMRTSSTPVYDEQHRIIAAVSVFHDITDTLAAEEALRRSEKLAAAGRFAATVAHEINNPLEAATNLLYLASQGSRGKVREYLEKADHELRRVAQIARKTLAFYRETGPAREFALIPAVQQVVSLYARSARDKGVKLVLEAPADVVIRAREGEVQQVVSNLVANAIDACSAGAQVRVRVRRVGETARITVADTGSGIPPANLRKIWEPFFTSKPHTGTGLGLWVSRDLVAKNAGSISVRSAHTGPRRGTLFVVTFAVPAAATQKSAIAG